MCYNHIVQGNSLGKVKAVWHRKRISEKEERENRKREGIQSLPEPGKTR